MYFVATITVTKGSHYIVQSTREQYNALMGYLKVANLGLSIDCDKSCLQEVWNEIRANESLKYEDYMLVDFEELKQILEEVFGAKYYR